MGIVKNKPLPELRFPEFDDTWEVKKGEQLFTSSRTKGREGLPIYSVTLNNGLVPRDSLDRRLENDAATEDNLSAQKGDLVYNMMRMWQGAVGLANEECMISPAYVVLRPKNDTDSKFFDFNFNRSRPLYDLWAYSYGLTSDRLRLYFKDFGKIKFVVPSTKEEQQKIATFLSAIDDKINKLRLKRELLETYKRGLMQKIFSQEIRFKRDDGSSYPDWKSRPLGEILIEHKKTSSGKEPVYSVSVHKGLVNQVEHLGRSYSAVNTNNYNLVQRHDVVYTKSPTGSFPFGIIKQSRINISVIVSPLYGVFTPVYPELGMLVDMYFNNEKNTLRYLRPIVQKGAKNTININNTTFLSGSMRLPESKDEVSKIVLALDEINKKIERVQDTVSLFEKYKAGLLQKMFV